MKYTVLKALFNIICSNSLMLSSTALDGDVPPPHIHTPSYQKIIALLVVNMESLFVYLHAERERFDMSGGDDDVVRMISCCKYGSSFTSTNVYNISYVTRSVGNVKTGCIAFPLLYTAVKTAYLDVFNENFDTVRDYIYSEIKNMDVRRKYNIRCLVLCKRSFDYLQYGWRNDCNETFVYERRNVTAN